jgi:hypothetical protein
MIVEVVKNKSTPSSGDELKSVSSEVKKVIKVILNDLNANKDSLLPSHPKPPKVSDKHQKDKQAIEKPIGLYPENGIINLHWDPNYCAEQIVLSADNMSCFLAENGYCFRTVMANTPIMGGIAYWEIHGDSRTENELKIGITSKRTINLNTVTVLIKSSHFVIQSLDGRIMD